MTAEECRIYDRMGPEERAAVDACRPELQGLTCILWQHAQKRRARAVGDDWKRAPDRTTVDHQRHPPEDDGRYGR